MGMDCSSINDENDLFVVDLVFKDRVGENLALDVGEEHRWYYYPQMEFEEALLFKTYDSTQDEGLARFCIHSAFDDPLTKEDDPVRESIEVRVLAIHAPTKSDLPKKVRTVSESCCPVGDHS